MSQKPLPAWNWYSKVSKEKHKNVFTVTALSTLPQEAPKLNRDPDISDYAAQTNCITNQHDFNVVSPHSSSLQDPGHWPHGPALRVKPRGAQKAG